MRVLLIQEETDIHLFHESSYFFDIGVRFLPEILAIIYLNSDLKIGRSGEKICGFLQPPNTGRDVILKQDRKAFFRITVISRVCPMVCKTGRHNVVRRKNVQTCSRNLPSSYIDLSRVL
jgi:hypothetical protein